MSDYFDFEDDQMKQFLLIKKHMFTLDERGFARARTDFDPTEVSNNEGKPGQKRGAN